MKLPATSAALLLQRHAFTLVCASSSSSSSPPTAASPSCCWRKQPVLRRNIEIRANEELTTGDDATPRVTKPLRNDTRPARPPLVCQATNARPLNGQGPTAATSTTSTSSSSPSITSSASTSSSPSVFQPLADTAESEEPRTEDTYTTGFVSEKTVESLSHQPFPPEAVAVLQAPLEFSDVASKPTGRGSPPVPYLPEIKYRRILNKAFGPGAWTLLPAGPVRREGQVVTRDYQMFVFGRLVCEARGQQECFSRGKTVETAVEGIKSNALMRCCKDLGIASELWDPDWVKKWQLRQPLSTNNTPNQR